MIFTQFRQDYLKQILLQGNPLWRLRQRFPVATAGRHGGPCETGVFTLTLAEELFRTNFWMEV